MRTTKLLRFTPWRSFGLRQIAAVRLPRLRISKTLVVIIRKRTHDKQSKFKKRQLQTYASLFMNYRLEVWCGTLKT